MIQCLLTLLLAPRSAAAQGGSGGRGEDTHEGRVAMLDQFIRSGLAQEVTAYVRSFELTQIPDALADERRIFGQMLDQGLLAEAELSPLPYQIGQCFDRSGKSACASARKGDRRGRICFDPDRCAFEYPPRVYDENAARRMLVGTALHEKGHQFGFEEADASRISAYVRATLGASGPEGLTRPPASAVALGQASSGRDLGLEIERLRWQGAPQSARRILESCGGDFACLRNYSRDQLPDGLSRLLHESCLWPYLRYVPKTLFVRGEGFQSGDADPAAAPLCLKAGLAAVAAAALP
ncbi:MAG TPA: hypothetical protein VM598_03290, partial [Bdellovibrionota bacterium]|nr:hypothetical protein [Bdellovibrionota bacterium]